MEQKLTPDHGEFFLIRGRWRVPYEVSIRAPVRGATRSREDRERLYGLNVHPVRREVNGRFVPIACHVARATPVGRWFFSVTTTRKNPDCHTWRGLYGILPYPWNPMHALGRSMSIGRPPRRFPGRGREMIFLFFSFPADSLWAIEARASASVWWRPNRTTRRKSPGRGNAPPRRLRRWGGACLLPSATGRMQEIL